MSGTLLDDITKKVMLHLIESSCPKECCGTITWSESHVTPQCSCLDLKQAIVLLTTLLAFHDANTSVWQKRQIAPNDNYCWSEECNVAIEDSICSMWCWYQHQWHHMTKISHVKSYFSCLNVRNAVVLLMMQWQHVTQVPVPVASYYQTIMLNLISGVLTYKMQWCHW